MVSTHKNKVYIGDLLRIQWRLDLRVGWCLSGWTEKRVVRQVNYDYLSLPAHQMETDPQMSLVSVLS
jgi:hypothetical protein